MWCVILPPAFITHTVHVRDDCLFKRQVWSHTELDSLLEADQVRSQVVWERRVTGATPPPAHKLRHYHDQSKRLDQRATFGTDTDSPPGRGGGGGGSGGGGGGPQRWQTHRCCCSFCISPPAVQTGGSALTLTGVNRCCCRALVHTTEAHVVLFIY